MGTLPACGGRFPTPLSLCANKKSGCPLFFICVCVWWRRKRPHTPLSLAPMGNSFSAKGRGVWGRLRLHKKSGFPLFFIFVRKCGGDASVPTPLSNGKGGMGACGRAECVWRVCGRVYSKSEGCASTRGTSTSCSPSGARSCVSTNMVMSAQRFIGRPFACILLAVRSHAA